MLLFGFLLLFTVLATAQDLDNVAITVCVDKGIIKSLGPQGDDEAQTAGCSSVGTLDVSYPEPQLLYLGERKITGFEPGWYRLNSCSSRVELILVDNRIGHLQNGMIDSRNLIYLDLSRNYIHKIDSGALNKSEVLETLYLRRNRLENTKFAETLPPSLKRLSLAGNEIETISPYSFSELGKLKSLELQGNKITTILQNSFHGLKSVDELDLSCNPIKEVKKFSFSHTPLLDIIILMEKPLRYKNLSEVVDLLPLRNDEKFTIVPEKSIRPYYYNRGPRTE